MRIMPEAEAEIRRAIRDARAADPIISVHGVQLALEKRFNRTFSHYYVVRMMEKVSREAIVEADRTTIDQRLNITREKFRIASDRLMQILNWDPPPYEENETYREYRARVRPPDAEDIIQAAKVVATLDLLLLRAELEYGVYKGAASSTESRDVSMLPPDTASLIGAAFEKWKLVTPVTLRAQLTERTMTVHATTTDIAPAA